MKKIIFLVFPDIIFALTISLTGLLHAQEFEKILLSEIIQKEEESLNRTITLKLRFKYMDNIFNKIVFYDDKNYDIEFDIYELKKKRQFQEEALNLKQGLEYLVTFTIKEIIKDEEFITGDLKSFTPYIIFYLPEGKKAEGNIKKAE